MVTTTAKLSSQRVNWVRRWDEAHPPAFFSYFFLFFFFFFLSFFHFFFHKPTSPMYMYPCDACRLYVNANSFILLCPVHQYFEVLEFLDTSRSSTTSVHAGLIWCFHITQKSDMGYRIFKFNVCLWYFVNSCRSKISQMHIKLKDPVVNVTLSEFCRIQKSKITQHTRLQLQVLKLLTSN